MLRLDENGVASRDAHGVPIQSDRGDRVMDVGDCVVRSAVVVVEPDDEVEQADADGAYSGAPPRAYSRAQLVRPLAQRIIRPIPASAIEQFYQEAHQAGLTADSIHQATLQSHEWHRKWTLQEETGHGYTEDFLELPTDYDRAAGAKNPSPEENDNGSPAESRNKRDRTSRSSSSSSNDSVSTLGVQLATKRRLAAPVVVRPVALRIALPAAVPAPFYIGTIPKDIDEALRHGQVSPLTAASSSLRSVSQASSNDSRDEPEPTATAQQDSSSSIVHIIADNDGSQQQQLGLDLHRPSPVSSVSIAIDSARDQLLHALAANGGETSSPQFVSCLDFLASHFQETLVDSSSGDSNLSCGMWLTLTKPTFFGNLGMNDNDDPLYTLGRMAFDMFSPTNLICSLQGNFNSVERVSSMQRLAMLDSVPKALRDEVQSGKTLLRTYNIVTAFTIEPPVAGYPNAPNKDVHRPIRGIMTTYGYTLPDPKTPNRQSVWITGGRIEPNDDPADVAAWKRQFTLHPPKHGFGEQAKLLAVKLLMGANMAQEMADDGSMEYTFTRPLGGHGMAYVDTLYVDESLRIVRGHRGTVFVFSRLPEH